MARMIKADKLDGNTTSLKKSGKNFWDYSWIHLAFIFLLAMLFFGNSIRNEIALDDVMVLSENTFVKKGISGIPEIFSHDSFYGATHHAASQLGWRYRPLSLTVFAVVYQFFGNDWMYFHLINVLCYALACIVAFRFISKWVITDFKLALVTTVFFVIHPVHCEVVANIKSLDEILAFLFTVSSLDFLLCHVKNGSKRNLWLSLLSFTLALFAKESSALFAGLFPLLIYCFSNKTMAQAVVNSWPFFLLTLLFVLIRISISAVPEITEGITFDPYYFASGQEKIATIALVFGKYFLLMVYPTTLIFDYGYNHIPYVSFSDATVLFSMVFHLLLAYISIRMCIKRQIAGFLLLTYLAGVLLMSNLFLNVGPIMAERFLFTPGFFLIVGLIAGTASLMQRITSRNPNQLFGVLLLVCIPFAYSKVLARNADWKNNSTLYQADFHKAPNSFRVLAFNGMEKVSSVDNLADTTVSNKAYHEAIGYFNRAFRIYPDYKNMYKEWGYAYLKLGQLDSAEWAWSRFKILNPSSQFHQIHDRLLSEAKFSQCMEEYNAHYRDKNYTYLIGLLSRALQYKKEDAATLVNLGKVYYLNQQTDSAKICWTRALQSDSSNAEAKSLIRLF